MNAAPETSWAGLAVWLVRRTGRLWQLLMLSAAARVAGQLLAVAVYVVAATAIVRAATGLPIDVPALVLTLVVLAVAKSTLRYLEHFSGHWVAFTALQRLRDLFLARLVPQAPAAVRGRAGAEMTARGIGDIDRIEAFFAHTFPPIVAAVLVPALGLLWLAAAVDPGAALLIAPFAAGVLLVPLGARRLTQRTATRAADARGELARRVGDDIHGTAEILSFGAQDARLDALSAADDHLGDLRARAAAVKGFRAAAALLVQLGGAVALIVWGAVSGADPLAVAAALGVALGIWASARGVDGFVAGTEDAFAAAARIRVIIDAEPAVTDPSAPTAFAPTTHGVAVELSDVTLRYPGARVPALQNVDARFPAGSWSYLVGVSGSGKSSLAAAVLRGWDPVAGVVRVDDRDIRTVRLAALRGVVGVVAQRPTLLRGTIAANLRLGAPDADEHTLWRALAVVGLDDWVAGRDGALDGDLAERGDDVSGGQLQRLALARALVGDPAVLILDEALSQLDQATADRLRTAVRADRPDRTVIEITHRVDVIPDRAHTVLLDGGRVLASGTAGTLRTQSEDYTRLLARVD